MKTKSTLHVVINYFVAMHQFMNWKNMNWKKYELEIKDESNYNGVHIND